jgi:hypothetical protein
VNGGDGDDLVFGDPGDDTVNGDLNNDQLYGQEGNDQLHGSDGADALLGGPSSDTMDGGLGDDYFFNGNWGSETVIGTGGSDSIRANNSPFPPSVTINLISGTGPEVTDSTNSFNWSGNVIEDAFLGPGNDRVSQNSSNNQMADFAGGSDTYEGYGPGGPASGNDIIGGLTGSPGDELDLSNFNTSQVQLLFGNRGPGTPATGLIENFADGSRIDIVDYFDGTRTGCLVGPGDGLIETISFANEPNVGFGRAKQLIGCSTTADTSAPTTRAISTDSAQADQLQVGNLKDEQTAPAPPRPSVATDASTYQKR